MLMCCLHHIKRLLPLAIQSIAKTTVIKELIKLKERKQQPKQHMF